MRASMNCVGYRDQLSLLFRDENARTEQRSIAAKDRSRGSKAIQSIFEVNQLSLVIGPSMPIDERGLDFFLDRFTTIGGQSPAVKKVHPFIESIISTTATREALISVGLAALSNVTGNKTYLAVALQKYVTGINIVRRAMSQPLKKDLGDIIKLALVLTLFEVRQQFTSFAGIFKSSVSFSMLTNQNSLSTMIQTLCILGRSTPKAHSLSFGTPITTKCLRNREAWLFCNLICFSSS